MKYIVCDRPGTFSLLEKGMPMRKPNEALLKIARVGICGTDLHAFQGHQPFFSYPRILGHELAAEIIDIDDNTQRLVVGDRVIIMPYISCGTCIACQRGKTNCCESISVLGVHEDGGMQEYYTVSSNILVKANSLSEEQIALVEPLAIGAHAISRAKPKKNETALVIGCGPIGLGLMKQLQLEGANVIAMDIQAKRLAFAKDVMGIEQIALADDTAKTAIRELNDGQLPTLVFDATGNKHALESGIQFMAHGGTYILVGLYKGDLTFNHPLLHSRETTLLSSRNATMADILHVKKMLESGLFPDSAFITHRVHFTDMIDHFESWIKPETGVIKAMVYF
jgi:2-desacetyl-2-hydroxyethyl bacteriochlorophyllide A dehydrogenase